MKALWQAMLVGGLFKEAEGFCWKRRRKKVAALDAPRLVSPSTQKHAPSHMIHKNNHSVWRPQIYRGFRVRHSCWYHTDISSLKTE